MGQSAAFSTENFWLPHSCLFRTSSCDSATPSNSNPFCPAPSDHLLYWQKTESFVAGWPASESASQAESESESELGRSRRPDPGPGLLSAELSGWVFSSLSAFLLFCRNVQRPYIRCHISLYSDLIFSHTPFIFYEYLAQDNGCHLKGQRSLALLRVCASLCVSVCVFSTLFCGFLFFFLRFLCNLTFDVLVSMALILRPGIGWSSSPSTAATRSSSVSGLWPLAFGSRVVALILNQSPSDRIRHGPATRLLINRAFDFPQSHSHHHPKHCRQPEISPIVWGRGRMPSRMQITRNSQCRKYHFRLVALVRRFDSIRFDSSRSDRDNDGFCLF